jgi:hypothetical protein
MNLSIVIAPGEDGVELLSPLLNLRIAQATWIAK